MAVFPANVQTAPEQQAPPTIAIAEITPTVGPATGSLTVFDLERQADLQTKVSFEVRRSPLTELLAELEKQTGTKLGTDLAAPPLDVRVTARVSEMPLWDVLGALSRLYGVTWFRDADKSYTFHPGLDDLHRKLLRVSAPNSTLRLGPMIKPDWAHEILPNVPDPKQLRTRQGVSLTVLPEELQKSLRERLEPFNAVTVVREYRRFYLPRLFTPHYLLRVEPEAAVRRRQDPPAPTTAGNAPVRCRLMILTPNGRPINGVGFVDWEAPIAPWQRLERQRK